MLKTILVVDDEDDVREIAESMIDALGYLVISAANGLTALRLFDEKRIDAILTDIRMPEMDGFQLAAAVRKRNPSTPIVYVSGLAGVSPDHGHGREFLRKPYRMADLEAVLKRVLPT